MTWDITTLRVKVRKEIQWLLVYKSWSIEKLQLTKPAQLDYVQTNHMIKSMVTQRTFRPTAKLLHFSDSS